MKRQIKIALLSSVLILSGCASNGGFATAANGGCDTERTAAIGALVGATAGFLLSNGNANSSAQNNRAIGLGALVGAGIAAGLCVATKTVQKKSAATVEDSYKKQYGSLPEVTKVTQYTTALDASTVKVGDGVVVRSNLNVIGGVKEPLKSLRETLVLKNAQGKVLKTITKDISQSGSHDSGEFENSFSWKFPANVSKGNYTIETTLLVNGNTVANNREVLHLI